MKSKTMYSSYSLQEHIIYVSIFAIQLLLICNVSSLNLTNTYLHHECRVKQGKYMHGSTYEQNLNKAFRGLSEDPLQVGFTLSGYGRAPNYVNIRFQCRGDSYGSKCHSCAAVAVVGFRKRCERNKGGIIWYDQCYLDVSTIRKPLSNYDNSFTMHNPNNVRGDTKLFNKKTTDFLNSLILKADKVDKDGKNFLYYSASEVKLGSYKLYAMVQCMNDVEDCTDCLKLSIKELFKCCAGKQGARVMSLGCNLRYELYPFIRPQPVFEKE